MSFFIQEKLLGLSAKNFGDCESSHHFQNSVKRRPRQSTSMNEGEFLKKLHAKEHCHGGNLCALRRRFLYRLAIALHTYGSSASRTEYLIERAAERLDVGVRIAVFPSLILLSFTDNNDDSRNESHMITVESSLDVDKLGRADELAYNVGKHDTHLMLAYWKLRVIAVSRSQFESYWWRVLSFALSGGTAALLFFKGSYLDACISLFLGLIVGILDKLSKKFHIMARLLEFTAALTVSFLARIFSYYLGGSRICYSNIALSSLVQLLPGMALTLGVSDMVAKSHITGTCCIIYTFFSALQLGFGLTIGESLVFWVDKRTNPDPCEGSDLPLWWNLFWFLGYTISSNILLNARLKQWPGMTLASGAGYIVYSLTGQKLGSNASSMLAALSVSITGTFYSYFTGDLPLVMVLSGILLLVPGGLGVQGIQAMLDDDLLSGMDFVFKMLVVGLAITIGLLMAKVLYPARLMSARLAANDKTTLAAAFEEEDMAI